MLAGKNGILNRAAEAKEQTEKAKLNEKGSLEDIYSAMNSFENRSLASKVEVGDYISYYPDDVENMSSILGEILMYSGNTDNKKNNDETLNQEKNLKWRVINIKNGKVKLIASTPTTSKITLSGAKGYNNGVYLLDKICNTLYSKKGYSEQVQNLKIEDIQNYIVYNYKNFENIHVDTNKYGGTRTYTDKKYYPCLFLKEKNAFVDGKLGNELELSEQNEPIAEEEKEAITSIKVTQTYWYRILEKEDFSKEIYYKLLINDGEFYPTYWMSSRCVDAFYNRAGFIVRFLYAGHIAASYLYYSDGEEGSIDLPFRPCVTLNSDVLVGEGNGTLDFPYEITLKSEK